MSEASVGGQPVEALTPRARRAIWGAFAGFFVDSFDIFLPVIVLAPAAVYFFSPEIPASAVAILSAMVFVVTLIGRPIGAIIFGSLADRVGRKRMTVIAVTGFGVLTMLIGLLPGYEQWGIMAIVVLIVLRLLDGIFLGGEYTAANPLAMEYSPKQKRGFYGALIQSGAALAFAATSLLTLVLLLMIPAGDLNSPYVQWGWRIPFFIGAAMAFALAIYYAYFVDESEMWQESAKAGHPLKTVLGRDNLPHFLQVFVLMNGFWFLLYALTGNIPRLLASEVGLSSARVTIVTSVAWIAIAISFMIAGVLSQRIGRRMCFILTGAIAATAGTFFYYLLISTNGENFLMVVILAAITAGVVFAAGGLPTVYITERFRTDIRASAFGLAYSLAIIPPSFYAFYQAILQNIMPAQYTVLVLVAVGGVLIVIGAALGPETKDVDFKPVSRDSDAAEPSGVST